MSVRDTSIATYHDIISKSGVGQSAQSIARFIAGHVDPVSRRQVARGLNMETSSVAGRVNELIKCAVIAETPKMLCPISKRSVYGLVFLKNEK